MAIKIVKKGSFTELCGKLYVSFCKDNIWNYKILCIFAL